MYTKPPTKKGSCLNERIVVIINASALSSGKKFCSNKILKNGAQDCDNTLVQTIDSLNYIYVQTRAIFLVVAEGG